MPYLQQVCILAKIVTILLQVVQPPPKTAPDNTMGRASASEAIQAQLLIGSHRGLSKYLNNIIVHRLVDPFQLNDSAGTLYVIRLSETAPDI